MASPGDLIAQAGQNVGAGIQEYIKTKRADATATGQIEAYLGQIQQSGMQVDPTTSSQIEKFTSGKMRLNDKMEFLGNLQTQKALITQDLQQKQAQMEYQNSVRSNSILNGYLGGQQQPGAPGAVPTGGGMAPAGAMGGPGPAPAPSPAPAPGMPAVGMMAGGAQAPAPGMAPVGGAPGGNAGGMASGNLQGMVGNYVRSTGRLPTPEYINQIQAQMAQAEQPLGVVYNGAGAYNANGTPTKDIYNRVFIKGKGTPAESTRIDNTNIEVPYGSQAPGPLLHNDTLQPIISPSGVPAQTPPPAPRQMTPELQKEIQDANSDYQTLSINMANAQGLAQAAQQYAASGLSKGGGNLNWVTGSPMGLKVRQTFGDGSGQALEGAAAPMASTVMQSLKNVRNQREFSVLMDGIPKTTDPDSVAIGKSNYFVNQFQQLLGQSRAYKDNLVKGMSPGDAEAAAVNAYPIVPFNPTKGGKAAAAPAAAPEPPKTPSLSTPQQQALNWAQQNPNDPRAALIIKKLGM